MYKTFLLNSITSELISISTKIPFKFSLSPKMKGRMCFMMVLRNEK